MRTSFRIEKYLFIIVMTATVCAPGIAAVSNLEELATAQWRKEIVNMKTPSEGCFEATFPDTLWHAVPCRSVGWHSHPEPRVATTGDEPLTTGNGNDYALKASGLITTTVGRFPSVSDITSESSVGVPAFGDGGILGPNEYSLQINTNANESTPACANGNAHCIVWQQFIYATDYETEGSAAVFMEYWLLRYGPSCPSNFAQVGTSCLLNSPYIAAPNVPITGLGNLTITGAAVPGGNDTVTFANGTQAYSVSARDSLLQIGTVWNESEFNIVGDAGGSEAVFNSGADITLNVSAQYGSTVAPACATNAGTTGETNNLILGSCVAAGGATPSIQFTESSLTPPATPVKIVPNAPPYQFTDNSVEPVSVTPSSSGSPASYFTFCKTDDLRGQVCHTSTTPSYTFTMANGSTNNFQANACNTAGCSAYIVSPTTVAYCANYSCP